MIDNDIIARLVRQGGIVVRSLRTLLHSVPLHGRLRILRQWAGVCDMTPDYSPILGVAETDRFYLNGGSGTGGFKAIPSGGLMTAELVATGRVPSLIAPFALTRFREDRAVSEQASAGTH